MKNLVLRFLGFGCWTCYRKHCQYKRWLGVCGCFNCKSGCFGLFGKGGAK